MNELKVIKIKVKDESNNLTKVIIAKINFG